MRTFLKDLQHGVRLLVTAPSYAGIVVLTLTLAIGANTLIFSIASFLLLRPLPFEDPDTIAFVYSLDPQRGSDRGDISLPDYVDFRDQSTSFEQLGAVVDTSFNLTRTDEPMRVTGRSVTANVLPLWGFAPIVGRTFLEGEDAPEAAPVVVLSHGFWVRELDVSPEIIGSTLALDGVMHTVVGVLDPEVEIGQIALVDVWTPLVLDLGQARRDDRTLEVTGRLRPSVTVEQAAADLRMIASRLEDAHPVTNAEWGARVASFREGITGPNTWLVLALLGLVVTFVLLIACANVANLMLARVTARRKEMALRVALGAGRGQLIRQMLTESLLLGLLAGGAGLGVAIVGLDVIKAFAFEQVFHQIVVDHRVLLFTASLALVTPFLCSLAPALQASQVDLNETLKEGSGRSAGGRRGRRGRSALVVSQVALAVSMLIVAGLAARTAIALQRIDLGIDTSNVLTLQMDLPERAYPTDTQAVDVYRDAVAAIERLPGVTAAATVDRLPVFGGDRTTMVTIQGQPIPTPDDQPWAVTATASRAYPQVMKIPVMRGRGFSSADLAETAPVALISQEMASRYWPGTVDPLGQRVKLGAPDADGPWREVVGVVGDVSGSNPTNPPPPRLYVPPSQYPGRSMMLVVRTDGDPAGLVEPMRGEIRQLDGSLPVYDVRTLEQMLHEALATDRILIGMFVAFALVGVLLASSGLYGVLSYSVSQRTQEIGIRLALGAGRGRVLRMVVLQGVALAGTGALIGLAGGLLLAHAIAGTLYQVGATDPFTYGVVALGLAAVALVASYVPARRATRVDPLTALRVE